MIDAPLGFAFAAGLVATVNPCGFAMLPAYLSYFMGLEGTARPGAVASVARGLTVGAVVSAGFLLVFAVVGALVELGLRSVIDYVPWAALVIGGSLVMLGVAMLGFGYEPTLALPKLERGGSSRRLTSVFVFGVSYAVASLSCTLPVFLTVVATATAATRSVASGTVTFLAYGTGMALLLVVVTLALALAKEGLVRRLRNAARVVGRVSGAVLILAGGYIVWYWAANLRDPLAARGRAFRAIEPLQTWIATQLGSRPGYSAAVLGGVTAVALLSVAVGRARRSGVGAVRVASDRAPGGAVRHVPDRQPVP